MACCSEFPNVTGMLNETRESAIAAFDAPSYWRKEIETANERCLHKVFEPTSSVARAMGWPKQTIKVICEFLHSASKVQTELIDQRIVSWKLQLNSPSAPVPFSRGLGDQIPGFSGSAATLQEFNALAPWSFWIQAAQGWQRNWMPEATSRGERPR